MIKRAEVAVTGDNIWFLERYLSVFDFAPLFPDDAFSREGQRGVPIRLNTDLGFAIESDIDAGKMQLRSRSKHSGWMRWTTEKGLREGDRIVIEHLGDRDYKLILERNSVD